MSNVPRVRVFPNSLSRHLEAFIEFSKILSSETGVPNISEIKEKGGQQIRLLPGSHFRQIF